MFSLKRKRKSLLTRTAQGMIYSRFPFGFEMSEVRLQILLSGVWSAGLCEGSGGGAARAMGGVLALVNICTVTLVNETVVCSQFKSVDLVTILLKPIENKLACVSQTTEGFLPAFSRFRRVSWAVHICMDVLCLITASFVDPTPPPHPDKYKRRSWDFNCCIIAFYNAVFWM